VRGFFPANDFEDLVQELTLELLTCVQTFNPDCAKRSTFVKTVVSRKAFPHCGTHMPRPGRLAKPHHRHILPAVLELLRKNLRSF